MDGKEIYENFTKGDTKGLRAAADAVADLSSSYMERAQSIKALQDRMKKAWTGDAADAAGAGAGPLEQAFQETAEPLDVTKASVDTQASSFDASGHAVVEVPPKPDKPNPWTTGLKAAIPIAGPSMAMNDVKSYQQGMQKYNAANENNVRVMDQYSSLTSSTKSALPTDYGVLQSDGAAISVKEPTPPGTVRPLPGKTTERTQHTTNEQTTSSGHTPGRTSGDQIGGRPTTPSGTDGPGGTDGTGGPGDTRGAGRTGGGRDETTTPTGNRPGRTGVLPPPPFVPGRRPSGDPARPEPVVTGLYNTGNPAGEPNPTGFGRGGEEPGSGRGGNNAGSRLLGGDGRGGVGENARGLGGGRGVGAGGVGNAAASEAAAARAAGGRGSGPMGPMGAHGRGGEREEDQEHQRPDFLIEPDPDALFGTDQKTSPPVIGE
ncbi:WXG100 family type VII secretion target [Amycolatopsis samaneae]|uniref:WXG100 family type VII secretion target n=1 Tax=Amycolatopsis samaneae TaxID=664691 RepID=A0ABW5GQS6_9PSEU